MDQSNAAWIKANLPDLPAQAIIAPGAPNNEVSSLRASWGGTSTNTYGYVSLVSDGSANCNDAECPSFALTYKSEVKDHIATIKDPGH